MKGLQYVTSRNVLHSYLLFQQRCPTEQDIMAKPCFYITIRVTGTFVPVTQNSKEMMALYLHPPDHLGFDHIAYHTMPGDL
jgi:hypothetical protein